MLPDVTVAFTAPKYTTLLAGTALKLVPAILTLVPTGPLEGVKELTVGCAVAFTAIKRTNATIVLLKAGIKYFMCWRFKHFIIKRSFNYCFSIFQRGL
jgi:hypothetical protein